MSESTTKARVQAPRRTVTVTVEKANHGGILAEKTWHNYGRVFKASNVEPLSKDAVGVRVELSEVYSEKADKWFVTAFQELPTESQEAPPASPTNTNDASPEESSQERADSSDPAASPEALQYAENLAKEAGILSEFLEQIIYLRFGKAFEALTPEEASRTIVFLGGYHHGGIRGRKNEKKTS